MRPIHRDGAAESGASQQLREWRDPDSNRGHHEFQAPEIAGLLSTKTLHKMAICRIRDPPYLPAVCGRLAVVWAARCASWPKRSLSSALLRGPRSELSLEQTEGSCPRVSGLLGPFSRLGAAHLLVFTSPVAYVVAVRAAWRRPTRTAGIQWRGTVRAWPRRALSHHEAPDQSGPSRQRPKKATPAVIEGLVNLYAATATAGAKLIPFDAGINPLAPVSAPDGPRRAAILISSSPHKSGSVVTPWHDIFLRTRATFATSATRRHPDEPCILHLETRC